MNRSFIWGIRQYQRFLSPFLGAHCLYKPSCSQYAVDAFNKYGFFRAFFKMIWRILRCNPFAAGGEDPA